MYFILLNGGINCKAQHIVNAFHVMGKMIKSSKYQNGTLSIIEIKQYDSLQDSSMHLCSIGLFRNWQ